MTTVTDPVCDMQIDPEKAAGSTTYQGQTHSFCSRGLQDGVRRLAREVHGWLNRAHRGTKRLLLQHSTLVGGCGTPLLWHMLGIATCSTVRSS